MRERGKFYLRISTRMLVLLIKSDVVTHVGEGRVVNRHARPRPSSPKFWWYPYLGEAN